MATIGSISIQLAADLTKLQAGFRAGERATTAFGRTTERRVSLIERRLGGLGSAFTRLTPSITSLGRSLGPALGIGVGAIGLSKLISAAKDAVAVFDTLAKSARVVGLSTDFYQALGFAALEEGAQNVDQALKAFARRSGQLAAGQGELASFLKLTNKELLTQLLLAGSQEERLRLFADALANTANAEDKAALAAAGFSRAGIDLVLVLQKGSAGLDDYARRARDAGVIVDQNLLASAEKLNNTLGVQAKILDVNLKQAFVELVPLIIASATAMASVAREINRIVDSTRSLDQQRTQFLQDRVGAIDGRLSQFQSGGPRQAVAEATGRVDELQQERASIVEELRARGLQNLASALRETAGAQTELTATTGAGVSAFEGTVAALQFELDQLGRSSEAQELYNNLVRAGADLHSAEGQAIAAATTALQAKKAELSATEDATIKAGEASDYLSSSLVDGFAAVALHGEDAIDVAKRLALALAEAVLQAALLKKGPLAGLFSGGLSGLLNGGAVSPSTIVKPGYIYHGGGQVGAGGPSRRVSASGFAGAPRLHSGLSTNEYNAILQKGEHVLTERMANRTANVMDGLSSIASAGVGGGGGDVIINEAPGAHVGETKQNSDGTTEITLARSVDDVIANSVTRRGKAGRAIESTFGASRTRGLKKRRSS